MGAVPWGRKTTADLLRDGFSMAAASTELSLLVGAARGDELEVDWAAAEVRHPAGGRTLPLQPLAESERQTLEAGGLLPYLKARRSRAPGVQP